MSASEHAKCEGRCCQNVHETSMRVIQIRVSQWKRFLCTARLRQRIATLFCFFSFSRSLLFVYREISYCGCLKFQPLVFTAVRRRRCCVNGKLRGQRCDTCRFLKEKRKKEKRTLGAIFVHPARYSHYFAMWQRKAPGLQKKKKLTSR